MSPELREKLARRSGLGLFLCGIGVIGCILFIWGNVRDGPTWMKNEYVFAISVVIGIVGAIIAYGIIFYFNRRLTSPPHNHK
ncbi:unnamed protein product [Cylicostephanus goldi]|uniref:Uncharacterized protein n=1 Tax=Cylicostephanus goldi TaxID=71465 RepID=A0A3P6TBJ0_CYLGO|nr:unnamed protein product [Cylicostephanus goldi]